MSRAAQSNSWSKSLARENKFFYVARPINEQQAIVETDRRLGLCLLVGAVLSRPVALTPTNFSRGGMTCKTNAFELAISRHIESELRICRGLHGEYYAYPAAAHRKCASRCAGGATRYIRW